MVSTADPITRGMTHELCQSLNQIVKYAELLAKPDLDEAVRAQLVASIRITALRLDAALTSAGSSPYPGRRPSCSPSPHISSAAGEDRDRQGRLGAPVGSIRPCPGWRRSDRRQPSELR